MSQDLNQHLLFSALVSYYSNLWCTFLNFLKTQYCFKISFISFLSGVRVSTVVYMVGFRFHSWTTLSNGHLLAICQIFASPHIRPAANCCSLGHLNICFMWCLIYCKLLEDRGCLFSLLYCSIPVTKSSVVQDRSSISIYLINDQKFGVTFPSPKYLLSLNTWDPGDPTIGPQQWAHVPVPYLLFVIWECGSICNTSAYSSIIIRHYGSVSKEARFWACTPKSGLLDLHVQREPTPTRFPPPSTCPLWYLSMCTCVCTQTHIIKRRKLSKLIITRYSNAEE